MKNILFIFTILTAIGLSSCKDTLPSAPQNNSKPGLVAWFKLDQNTADSSGNKHDATLQGGSFVPDRFGYAQSALKLDGNSSSYASVSDNIDLDFDSLASFSVSAWIKTSSADAGYIGVVSKGPANGSLPGYTIGIDNGFAEAQLSGEKNPTIRGTTKINDNNWHLITLTVAANIAAAVYVDGIPEGGYTPIQLYPDRNNHGPLFIGANHNTGFFTGTIDDIRIYSKLLTPNDISLLFVENGWSGAVDTTKPVDTTGGNKGTFSGNGVDNSGFITTVTSSQHLDGASCPPWDVAYGAPFSAPGPGADGVTKGFLYMWGTSDDGCAVWEPLKTPIVKGQTYRIKCSLEFRSVDLHNTPYVTVRFLAFNQFGTGIPWQTSPGQIASLGSVTVTKLDTWDQYVTVDWIADANYSNFQINVQNNNSGPNSESWVAIDDVQLQEKQ
jgi:hypothetical protein